MECKDLTFDKLSEAVAYLIEAVAEIKSLVKNKTELPEKRIPIGIEDACRIIQKAKPTIYALVRKGLLPSYKRGKKLFFFEEELLEWIAKGKKKTILDIRAEMEADLYSKSRRR
ncbi:helix-turn-helix domain-containing protein [Dysgonomonas sp.]|uniref:helix-turn-helix domain-containing protein n=1 Tax=Dysgonomonas sp. TaxID=1891233 RepID=UPI0027B945A5|nr:helix-turn-helix domain-containing protein [Dysgonomonas sp.]